MSITTELPNSQAAFTQHIRNLLNEAEDGKNLQTVADEIIRHHEGIVGAMAQRLSDARDETAHAIGNATMRWQMSEALVRTVEREVRANAALHADLHLAQGIIQTVTHLVDNAPSEDDAVAVKELAALLGAPLMPPTFRPYIAAYVESHEMSHGTFKSADGAIVLVFPFKGWAQVVNAPGGEGGSFVPCFLVDNQVVPATTVSAERHVELTNLT